MKISRLLPALVFLLSAVSARAEDLGEFVLHHIINSKVWHVTPWGPTVRFPEWSLLGVDLSLTLHTAMILLAGALLLVLVLPAARRPVKKYGAAPSGRFAHAVEALVVFIRDEVVVPNLGEKDARKWLPFFLTIFFFLLMLNIVGLVPGFGSATSNINFTATFALLIFVLFNLSGIRHNGLRYFSNLVPKGLPLWLLPLIAVIEVVGLFTKTVALALRLFANMTAGHALIFSLLGLIIVFKSHLAALPMVPFTLFIYLIEILVAFLQAYIFTLLASLFIGQAVHQEH